MQIFEQYDWERFLSQGILGGNLYGERPHRDEAEHNRDGGLSSYIHFKTRVPKGQISSNKIKNNT